MASVLSKAFLLVQLLLLVSCLQEASCNYPPENPPTHDHNHDHDHHHDHGHDHDHGHYHHHGYAPGYPPVGSPVQPPSPHHSHPLIPAPSHSPFRGPPFLRKPMAVQGVVYCKSCQYTLNGAKPIIGAEVKLLCRNTRYPVAATAKTDPNGYFFIQAPKTVTNFAFHKCKVYLVSSPFFFCSQPSNLNGGKTGASLKWELASLKLPYDLYSVGPLAFEPKCKAPGTM